MDCLRPPEPEITYIEVEEIANMEDRPLTFAENKEEGM
jgi:hypothetical protein